MNRIIIIWMICFPLILLGQGSNYIVNETGLWSTLEVHCMPTGNNYSTYHVKLEGDTVIDGLSYKKVWKTWEEALDNWVLNCFIRENDQGEIYLLPLGYIEGLVYSFNVEEGDTVQARNLYLNLDTLNFIVTSVDSVELLDGYHKRIWLYEYMNDKEEVWVEGVGSWYGILNSCNDSYGGACGLYSTLCYEESSTLVYQDPQYETCHYDVFVSVENQDELDFTIFPNPVQTHFEVCVNNISDYQHGLTMNLIDGSGKIILTNALKSKKNNVYLRQVDKGLYIITLHHEEIFITSCKLIID